MKFSIITVCFNSDYTIQETIESVKNQTYTDYEHIIIDGKSKDRTLEIIEKYSLESEKVKYISEKDDGIYNAMNKGINMAKGELIVFLNSDDTFEADTLELINNNYSNDVDIIYGNVYWRRKENKYIFEKELDLNPGYMENSIITKSCLDKIKNAHNATFVRLDILKQNLFDENYRICADYKFFLKMYQKKVRVRYIPNRITTMKIGGISTTELEKGLKEHINAEKEVLGQSKVCYMKVMMKVKLEKIITKSLKILPQKNYIHIRYITRGWREIG